MGYTTDFKGTFQLSKVIDQALANDINEFLAQRHEYLVYPSRYCGWRISDSRDEIVWDGVEKFYSYDIWLQFLIKEFLAPNDIKVNGEVLYRGEDFDDIGRLRVVDNKVKKVKVDFGEQ